MRELMPQQWQTLLNRFAEDLEGFRPAIEKPFEQDGYVCATDTHILIRVERELVGVDYSTPTNAPMVSRVMPEPNPSFIITRDDIFDALIKCGIDNIDRETEDCPHCHGFGDVTWEFYDNYGDRHTMVEDCPCCDGEGEVKNGIDKYIAIKDHVFLAYFLIKIFYVMRELEIEEADVTVSKPQSHLFHLTDGIDILLMPLPEENKKERLITKCKTTAL